MQPSPARGQKETLTKALHEARSRYAVKALKLEEIDTAGFEQALEESENARIAYEQAREKLEAHMREHGG
jgi:uncharacterized membrane protein